MSWLALILCLMVMAMAVREIRDNRRRGIPINWPKTLVTGGGAILIALLADGGLIGAMALGGLASGMVVFFIVFVVGMAALIVAVNRRWPPAKA